MGLYSSRFWAELISVSLDILISPLKPSFINSPGFSIFCEELTLLSRRPVIATTGFEILKNYPGGLLLRAHGKDPVADAFALQNMITRDLLHKKEYSRLALPELERRGGDVICQLAIKPFGEQKRRLLFRDLLEEELRRAQLDDVAISLGGRTTIDLQIRGVTKQRAIRYATNCKRMDPRRSIYFGNEFGIHGNDRSVLGMSEDFRPAVIVNVGEPLPAEDKHKDKILEDGNGPRGTLNLLALIEHGVAMGG